MSLSKNIHDAFEVVKMTHDNVKKLLDYCLTESKKEDAEFISASSKILHYRQNDEDWDWCLYNFIILFQHSEDELLPNLWRDGPVYIMEINLSPDDYDEPMVNLARYTYAKGEISNWARGVSQRDFIGFIMPLYDENLEIDGDPLNYSCKGIDEKSGFTDYFGLKEYVGVGIPLTDITRENATERVFGGFRLLRSK